VFVVGNKLDLAETNRAVRREDVRAMCEPLGYCFLEISAKDRTNLTLFMDTLCAELFKQFGKALSKKGVPPFKTLPAAGDDGNGTARASPGRLTTASPAAADSPGRAFIKLGIRDPAEMVGNPVTPRSGTDQWVLRLKHTPDTIVHDDGVNIADRPVDLRAPPRSGWSCFGGWFTKN